MSEQCRAPVNTVTNQRVLSNPAAQEELFPMELISNLMVREINLWHYSPQLVLAFCEVFNL
jgi:hypothetical protein